ncbi:MAG: DUF4173 domain-containing protein [Symbiobacterium sp.]|uniref:DUF4153 domain-containing protein n=1 Tax=Symbiobacterium sp. TaxID=1971213 RepID=UPI003464D540
MNGDTRTNGNSRLALAALGTALLIGLLGDQLILQAQDLGLGSFLWVAALAGATVALARWIRADRAAADETEPGGAAHGGTESTGVTPDATAPDGSAPARTAASGEAAGAFRGEGRWLLAGAVLFAACLMWRASSVLQFLDVLAIGLCLGLAALTLRSGRISRAGVLTYPAGLVVSAAHHAVGPFCLLFTDVQWKALARGRRSRYTTAALRGLVIAIPLLLLFGSLLASADAVFAQLLRSALAWDAADWLGRHLFGILFFGFLAAGFLRTVLIQKPDGLPDLRQIQRGTFALGPIEAGVVLGLLDLLFLAFVAVQVRYLFGGADLVLATAGLTYAEYARSGFFELLQVTALVLPVMLALHWALPESDGAAHRLYRWLGIPLVCLLFVVMASAMQRMWLYVQEYGLTELRLYSTAFMAWLAFLFAWFLATVMRGVLDRFAAGALTAGLVVLLLLHALNPEALIVRTNVAWAQSTGRFDVEYAASLGSDALPALTEAVEQLPGPTADKLARQLRARWGAAPPDDWRTWNWGRYRGALALSDLLTK